MIMGLISSEHVPGDGRGWSSQGGSWKSGGVEMSKPREASLPPQHMLLRHQRQQRVPLRCPRCDSPNTKFCYYNNYNRSQPRHFCKACRRHWTDGGTLRNVPVGGRRKAKRPRTSRHPPAPNPNPVHHHQHHHHGASNELPHTQVLPPPPSFGPGILCRSLLDTPPPPPDYANSGDIGSSNRSYLLGALLPPPPLLHFGSGVPASHDTSMASPFTSFLNLAGQDDPTAVYAGFTISTGTAPWELLPPSSCSSSTVTMGSGLTVAGSSAYWGSCWDDLTGVLSPDHKHPTPLLPPPQDLQLS